ncbi:acyl-CoA dehydrogenase family protein [Variovorax sp. PBL-E5]|uniref:acyl-CoA dehydrogenase family protein n=1 Tax=Variovorax sp. PBL-E5 TaxID=434014 RepID=UPI001318428D|nr:acyl-CoA dehydrogenase [Variovorax sp. PBL-E5]VTU46047.1 Acyl-CoA dehydrogenase fadE12 [Variovorax sp. PBL-E5]
MSLTPTDEEAMLAASAREFLARRASPRDLRALRDERVAAAFRGEVWQEMAAMGWAGMLVDEQHGGSDFGHFGSSLLCMEMGRQLSASPFVSTAVMGAIAMRGAVPSLRDRWLQRIADGKAIVALAVDESQQHAPTRTALTATHDGDGFILRGEKRFVVDGQAADAFVVAARTSKRAGDTDGLSLFLVEAGQPGITVQPLDMIDSRAAASVAFDGVRAGPDDVIGKVDQAWSLLEDVLDAGRLALAAELAGMADEVLLRTTDYLKQRRQFGQPIGSFQALQHRAADLYCQIELARSTVMQAARLRDHGDPRAGLHASVAKCKAGEAARRVTEEAVQMHGGVGMTDELDVGLFLKRARVAGALLGDCDFHADRVASMLHF